MDSLQDVKVDEATLALAVESLKNLETNTSISDFYKKKIEILSALFNVGAEAFKISQQIIEGFDTRILNEYQYYARATNTILEKTRNGVIDNDVLFAIDDAFTATKHIVNDVIDVLVLHSINEIGRLNKISDTLTVGQIYGDEAYTKLLIVITSVRKEIARTRSVRGVLRIERYLAFFAEKGEFSEILSFCQRIPALEENLKKLKKVEEQSNRLDVLAIIISLVAIVVSMVK